MIMFWRENFWCFSLPLCSFAQDCLWSQLLLGWETTVGSYHFARNCWLELRTFIIFPGTKEMMKPEDQLGTETKTTKSHRFIVPGTETPGIFLALMREPFVLTFDKIRKIFSLDFWQFGGRGALKGGGEVVHIKRTKCARWDCTEDHIAHDLPCR